MGVQSLAWASQNHVTWRKMMEPHRRETILVHLVWQELLRIRGLKETQENPQLVKIHEKIHTGEKAYKKNGMTTQATHTWEKAFKFTKCDKSFSSSNGWNNYKRTPTVEKLYVQKVWHELPRNRWIEEKWENHIGENCFLAQSVARSSLG